MQKRVTSVAIAYLLLILAFIAMTMMVGSTASGDNPEPQHSEPPYYCER